MYPGTLELGMDDTMSQLTSKLVACGCVAVSRHQRYAEIEFCPLHRAAPALAEALKNLIPLWDISQRIEDYQAEFQQAKQALALTQEAGRP